MRKKIGVILSLLPFLWNTLVPSGFAALPGEATPETPVAETPATGAPPAAITTPQTQTSTDFLSAKAIEKAAALEQSVQNDARQNEQKKAQIAAFEFQWARVNEQIHGSKAQLRARVAIINERLVGSKQAPQDVRDLIQQQVDAEIAAAYVEWQSFKQQLTERKAELLSEWLKAGGQGTLDLFNNFDIYEFMPSFIKKKPAEENGLKSSSLSLSERTNVFLQYGTLMNNLQTTGSFLRMPVGENFFPNGNFLYFMFDMLFPDIFSTNNSMSFPGQLKFLFENERENMGTEFSTADLSRSANRKSNQLQQAIIKMYLQIVMGKMSMPQNFFEIAPVELKPQDASLGQILGEQTFQFEVTENLIQIYRLLYAMQNLHPLLRWMLQQMLSEDELRMLYVKEAQRRLWNDLAAEARSKGYKVRFKFNNKEQTENFLPAIPPPTAAVPGVYSLTISATPHVAPHIG